MRLRAEDFLNVIKPTLLDLQLQPATRPTSTTSTTWATVVCARWTSWPLKKSARASSSSAARCRKRMSIKDPDELAKIADLIQLQEHFLGH